jgi:dipeptidyl aminopeptidase/acylaminoacyl peptidase
VAVAFPVTDLIALTAATHRFEAHYCEHLVGPFDTDLYRARSVDADGIFDPLLLLHGSADLVVDVGASRALVARLQALGRPAELVEYDGEGHGWRQSATMIDELNRLEAFLEARTVGGAP